MNGNLASIIYSEADANLVQEMKTARKVIVEDPEKVADIFYEMRQEVDDFIKAIPEEMRGGTLWTAPRLEDR